MSEYLKPCPICGKDSAVMVEQRNLLDEMRWCVYCTHCGLTQENFKYETKFEAAREWNRRNYERESNMSVLR